MRLFGWFRRRKTRDTSDVGGAIMIRANTAATTGEQRRITGSDRSHITPSSDTAEAIGLPHWNNKVKTHRFPMIIFFFINFFEQLLGPTNFYYFILGCVQLIKPISDSGGVPSNWVPVSFVIIVSMVKDGYEEWKRHRADNFENNQKTRILNPHTNEWQSISWKDVRPGDVILVRDGETFPADLIILESSDKFGICNAETSQLDGESNLKIKTCIPELGTALLQNSADLAFLQELSEESDSQSSPTQEAIDEAEDERISLIGEQLSRRHFELYAGVPTTQLYQFTGVLALYPEGFDSHEALSGTVSDRLQDLMQNAETHGATLFPLTTSQFLLRAASLQCTDYVVGLAAYTGSATRLFMNNTTRKPKQTKLFKTVMHHIVFQAILEVLMCLIMAILAATTVGVVSNHWYLFSSADGGYSGYDPDGLSASPGTWVDYLASFAATFLRMVLLLSYLIPVTLIVQVEVSHWFQAAMMQQDWHFAPHPTIEEGSDTKEVINESKGNDRASDDDNIDQGFSNDAKKKDEGKDKNVKKMPKLVKFDGCRVNSVDILDDLGCITHLYSDKTGTLTQNIMEFKCMAMYLPEKREVLNFGLPDPDKTESLPTATKASHDEVPYVDFDTTTVEEIFKDNWSSQSRDFLLCLSACHSVVIKNKTKPTSFHILSQSPVSSNADTPTLSASPYLGTVPAAAQAATFDAFHKRREYSTSPGLVSSVAVPIASPISKASEALAHHFDEEAEARIGLDPGMNRLRLSSKGLHRGFSTSDGNFVGNLNETMEASGVVTGVTNYPMNRRYDACFDASSPDELALVCAAKALGVEFVQRPTPDQITIAFRSEQAARLFLDPSNLKRCSDAQAKKPNALPFKDFLTSHDHPNNTISILPATTFRILEVLEFDNYRKKMSVIIRDCDGSILLLCKGADVAVLSSCAQEEDTVDGEEHKNLRNSILRMSRLGLRTLVFAKRRLSEFEYQAFAHDLLTARRNEGDGDDHTELQAVMSSVESNLTILGATGVNDRLQEECAETISAIKAAGICLWVLTGDKVETAISIATSTKLLTEETFNSIIDGNTLEDVYNQIQTSMLYIISERMRTGKPIHAKKERRNKLKMATWQEFLDLTKFTPESGSQRVDNRDLHYSMSNSSTLSQHELVHGLNQYLEGFATDHDDKDEPQLNAPGTIGKPVESRRVTHHADPSSTNLESTNLKVYDEMGLTITGHALELVINHSKASALFFALANLCSVVIACRVSPLQKAQVVNMSRQYYSKLANKSFCSLAIGDGANDVNMIMSADVGIGIRGKEGAQASRAADVAIREFRDLLYLLLIHGHEAVRRNSFMIYHTLWKNTFFGSAAFFYSFLCLYSGVDIYNLWIKQLYNLVFTCIPIMYFCMFDRYLPHHIMAKYSALYPTYSRPDGGMYFGKKWYFWWMILGFGSAAAVTYLPLIIMNQGTGPEGITYISLDSYGQCVYTLTVLLGNITVIPFVSCWSSFMAWTLISSILAYFMIWFGLSSTITADVVTSWSLNRMLTYHAAVLCAALFVLIPLLGWHLARIIFRPSRQTIIQERLRLGVHDLVIGRVKTNNSVLAPSSSGNVVNFTFAEEQGLNRLTMQQEVAFRRAGASTSATPTVLSPGDRLLPPIPNRRE